MKVWGALLSVCLLLLGVIAHAQEKPDAQLSAAEKAATDVAKTLRREFGQRSNTKDDPDAFAYTALNLVFLVDTSQFNTKEAYIAFTKSFMERLTSDFGRQQADAKIPKEQRHCIAFYPYQLSLIREGENVLRPVALTSKSVDELLARVPNDTIAQPGYEGRGHDSSQARADLLRMIGEKASSRQTVIFQITSMAFNQDPDHKENDAKIRAINARTGLLAGTGYSAYPDSSPYTTETPGPNVRPYDVYIWTFGPASFTASPKPPEPPASISAESSSGPNLFPFLIGTLLLAAGAAFALLARTRYRVQVTGSNVQFLSRGKMIPVETASNKAGANGAILIPEAKVSTAGAGQVVATVELGWFASQPVLRAKAPYSLLVDSKPASETALRPELRVKFADNQQSTHEVILISSKEK